MQSPFYLEVKSCCDVQTTQFSKHDCVNPKRNKDLAHRFLKQAMPYAPLWSSILEEPFRFACDSKLQRQVNFKSYREAIVGGFFRKT